jgi:hypothetical protein
MAPKGGNAKKESGRAKKAENEAKKQQAAVDAKVRVQLVFLHRHSQQGIGNTDISAYSHKNIHDLSLK